ncbi:MAG: DUF4382 domain-containing protein, partial [Gammaproteobacteria bacterium]|nr:DUF4382 domain-containing protein [Gammaproteobacteria bacterium]
MNKNLLVCSIALFGAACGSGGGDNAGDPTGILSVAVTDAAVEDVSVVTVEFSGITLKPGSGDEITFDFDPPKSINLLELQDG